MSKINKLFSDVNENKKNMNNKKTFTKCEVCFHTKWNRLSTRVAYDTILPISADCPRLFACNCACEINYF